LCHADAFLRQGWQSPSHLAEMLSNRIHGMLDWQLLTVKAFGFNTCSQLLLLVSNSRFELFSVILYVMWLMALALQTC